MRTLAEDTSPEAERVLIELWRQASPARKFAMIEEATRAFRESLLAGLRERYPADSPERPRRRFADLWLGPDLARQVFGPAADDIDCTSPNPER